MCGLICALHRERRGYLPTGRAELYDAALTMLLARRDRERGMGAVDGVELGEEAQLEILQRIAYALVLSARSEMDLDTAEGIVERCLPAVVAASQQGDAPTILRTLLLRSGLLRQPAPGVVDFVHRTFQDYLGARYAVEEGHLDVLDAKADDAQWEDVIRMAVAHARPRERATLIRRLLSRDSARTTLLALACLEQAAAIDPAVRAEVETQAALLIPPPTENAAKNLAKAGPLVLELLPGPAGLSESEARKVTVTASLLAADEPDGAFAVLRRYRDHPSLDVRRQLVGTWHRFDAREYATEVLDHCDRNDLFLTCTTREQRAALRHMRPWHQLAFRGPVALEELVASVNDLGAVNSLLLADNPSATSLGSLSVLSGLELLALNNCSVAFGLDRLADLPLTALQLISVPQIIGLRHLRKLTSLFLHGHVPDAAVWEEIASAPVLRSLYLPTEYHSHLSSMPELPGLTDLELTGMPSKESLRRLTTRLPGLKRLAVTRVPPSERDANRRLLMTALPGVDIAFS
jgi:hypothetical protein